MGLKLVSFTILIFSYALADQWETLLIGPASVIILAAISKQSAGKTVSALRAPLILLLTMSPFVLLAPGQRVLINFSIITIYSESLFLLGIMTFRSLTIFALLSILINGTKPHQLASSLKRLGIPGKLIIILVSTWRYINLYLNDLRQLITSARLRGFSMAKGFVHMGTSADMLLTLLIRSHEQSERVQAAMITRGFAGDIPGEKEHLPLTGRDIFLSAPALISSGLILILELLC